MELLLQVIPGKEIIKYQKLVFAEQDILEEQVMQLLDENKESDAITLINKFEEKMVDEALGLYERYHKPVAPLRINCGGPEYIDELGNVWVADQAADTHNKAYPTKIFSYTGGTAVSTGSKIANTDNDMCYQTARIGGNFEYNIYLPEGNYKVTLKFAEICPEEIFENTECAENGARAFHVTTSRIGEDFGKNIRFLSDFSIYEETKEINSALDKEFTVQLKRPQQAVGMLEGLVLNITLTGAPQDAILSGIEILELNK